MKFNKNTVFHYWIAKLLLCSIFSIFVIIFYTIWTVKVIQHLIQSIKLYRLNKRKDFRDSREQDRTLYNYETHIVKDVILIVLSCGEIGEVFFVLASAILTTLQQHDTHQYRKVNITSNDCTLEKKQTEVYYSDNFLSTVLFNILQTTFQNFFIAVGSISFLLLLSLLTQYLTKRYLRHSYTKSIFKHVLLFVSQFTIIVLLSNLELLFLHFLIVPLMIMVNWFILTKNSINLRKVLKSNVRDLELTFTHCSLFREQLKLLQTYTVFMPILLAALFFGALTILLHHYSLVVYIFFVYPCPSRPVATLNYEYINQIPIGEILITISRFCVLGLMSIHLLLLGLPLYAVSIRMFASACFNRIRRKEQNYRFNYSNFSNIRCPY